MSITRPHEVVEVEGDSSSRTGIVYDQRCTDHSCNYKHEEAPERVSTIYQFLCSKGLAQRCRRIDSRVASTDALTLTHPVEHVQFIDDTANHPFKDPEPDSETEGDDTLYPDCKFLTESKDTFVSRGSATAARVSAGCLLSLSEAVARGEIDNGFAVIRPPGHHANLNVPSGFCLYNNVVVSAQYLRFVYTIFCSPSFLF